VHQLFIDCKKAYDSVKREVLYNIPLEFGIPKKLVRLIKMCLNETYSKVRVGKHLSDKFPVQNGLKQGDALSPLLFNCALEYAIRKGQENQVGMEMNWPHQLLVNADINLLGDSTRCGYEVLGMILLQASHLYTYSLLRGVTFEVLPLSTYALSPTRLPLLEAFMENLFWNSFQWRQRFFMSSIS
jgi:hypothetical protein